MRRAGHILCGVSILIFAGLLGFTYFPTPDSLDINADGATGYFRVSNDKLLLPTGCREFSWEVNNIQAIFFNGEATVGERTVVQCNAGQVPPTLTVQFQGGNVTDFDISLTILTAVSWYRGWMLAAALALVIGI
ncbi:MAG: hypothetical protein AAF125_18275, partial [Chloroflexota bacterium]